MIENLKPYPETKNSGLPWLGEMPAHWDVSTLGGLAQVKSATNQSERQLLSVYLQHGVVRFSDVHEKRTNTTSEDLSKYQAVDPGDFVLNNQQAWRGSVGVSDYTGIISPAYLVLKLSKQYLPAYANLLFRDQCMVSQYLACSKGVGSIQRNLYWPHLKRVGVVIPPPEEQAAIARFLAWATSLLDRAIGAKRRIIALLQEQKQAIIHRAVTRGLDPSVPLKDSGIPWLGEIPEHWEARRLRRVVKRIDQGVSPLATGFLAEGNSWGVLKSGCVNRGIFRETEHKQLSQSFKIDSSIVVKLGDVLISRACGSPSLVGSVGRVRQLHYNLILSDKTFRPTFEESVDIDFMVLAMNSSYYRRQVEQAISGAEGMANNLPLSSLRDFSLAIPPLNEAKAIACSVEKSLSGINVAIARNEQEITLLREYRTSLIANVVTGKLDVREVAAGLPEDVESLDVDAQGDEIEDLEPGEDEEPELP
jgi:type I restriction enzyme, S subunit